MNTKESIYNLHEENTVWLNKLDFYKDDLQIFKDRLQEIAAKNSSKEVLAEVEHFQNQFYIQQNNMDNITHAIKLNEQELMELIKSNPVVAGRRKADYHEKEHDLVVTFEKNFKNLRKEFNSFSTKWM
jgi:hypothetical protein